MMTRKTLVLLSAIFAMGQTQAQKSNFSYQFYGFIRGDLFYNTRANQAPVDGNFYLYPLDKAPDAYGNDQNATPNGSFYTFTSRLGLNIKGPEVGTAKTQAKVEVDFGGFSSSTTMLRIRQAYVSLNWKRSELLIGQTWHPLFGQVIPDVLNLSTGAPYQPFNREPQLNYTYRLQHIRLTAAALWQLQYVSNGPNGGSEEYLKNSCIPELYAGIDYKNHHGLLIGAGIHFISLKPRTRTEMNGKPYKVNERMSTFSCEVHTEYRYQKFRFAAKTLLASCLDHTALLGGYGISSMNPTTGEQTYTPFRHSTTWMNLTYGDKWKAHLFAGYTKNLGTSQKLINTNTYGMGLNIDQLYSLNVAVSYNLPHWQFGIEYVPATAWYGDLSLANGRTVNTHQVCNHRILALVMYHF